MGVKISEKVDIMNRFQSIVDLSQLKKIDGHRFQSNFSSIEIDRESIVHRLKSMEAKPG